MAQVEIINVDTRQAQSSVKALREELKSLKDQMAGMEEGSAPFLTLASRAGDVKHKIDEINESVSAASLDFGDMLSNVTRIGAGVGGVFTIAQSSMQLLGLDTTETTKAIQKLQAFMAIPVGFAAVDAGIKSLNKFATAIRSSEEYMDEVRNLWRDRYREILKEFGETDNLFADAFAHYTFGKSDTDFSEWFESLSKAQKNTLLFEAIVTRSFNNIKNVVSGAFGFIKSNLAFLGTAGALAGVFALGKGIKKAIDQTEQDYKDSLERQQKATEKALEQRQKDWEFTTAYQKKLLNEQFGAGSIEVYQEILKSYQGELDNVNKQIETLTGSTGLTAAQNKLSQLNAELSLLSPETEEWILKLIEVTAAQEEVDRLQKGIIVDQDTSNGIAEDLVEQQKFWNEKVLEARKALLEQNALLKARGNLLSDQEIQRRKNLKLILKPLKQVLEIVDEISVQTNGFDKKVEYLVKVMNGLDKQFEVLNDTFSRFSESSYGLSYSYINAITDIESAFKEMTRIILEDGEVGWSAYVKMATAGVNAVGSLLNSLAEEQDTSTREGFETSKKYQIAATVMNMLSGIMAAWSSAMQLPFPANVILGAANTAATAGLGAAQIIKIKNTQFEGGNTNASSTAINSTIIPPVDYSSAVQGARTEGTIRDTRQYVSVVEIDKVQKRVNVSESESKY